MPFVNGKLISPDDALAQNRCPECGRSLIDESALGHLQKHWRTQPKNDSDGKEGLRRQAMLRKYVEDHKIAPAPVE